MSETVQLKPPEISSPLEPGETRKVFTRLTETDVSKVLERLEILERQVTFRVRVMAVCDICGLSAMVEYLPQKYENIQELTSAMPQCPGGMNPRGILWHQGYRLRVPSPRTENINLRVPED